MLKRIFSTLIAALMLTVSAAGIFARSLSDGSTPAPAPIAESKPTANENLRASVDHLVAETKAGQLAISERAEFHPPRSNNLSKKTKVAIGVGVALAVIVVIAVVHERNRAREFRGFTLAPSF